MTNVSIVAESQNEQIAVPIAVQWQGAVLDDWWDGLLDHAPCHAQGISLEDVKADLIKQGLLHA